MQSCEPRACGKRKRGDHLTAAWAPTVGTCSQNGTAPGGGSMLLQISSAAADGAHGRPSRRHRTGWGGVLLAMMRVCLRRISRARGPRVSERT